MLMHSLQTDKSIPKRSICDTCLLIFKKPVIKKYTIEKYILEKMNFYFNLKCNSFEKKSKTRKVTKSLRLQCFPAQKMIH